MLTALGSKQFSFAFDMLLRARCVLSENAVYCYMYRCMLWYGTLWYWRICCTPSDCSPSELLMGTQRQLFCVSKLNWLQYGLTQKLVPSQAESELPFAPVSNWCSTAGSGHKSLGVRYMKPHGLVTWEADLPTVICCWHPQEKPAS